MTTDEPVFISLEDGAAYSGKITGSPDGSLSVATDNGDLAVTVENVKESWKPGGKSPSQIRQDRERTSFATNGPIKQHWI